jgi:hypothetical protein
MLRKGSLPRRKKRNLLPPVRLSRRYTPPQEVETETHLKDEDLEQILTQKLKAHPYRYLSILHKLIDGIQITISDEDLFELLKPRMVPRDEAAIEREVKTWTRKHKKIEKEKKKVLKENPGRSKEEINEEFDKRHTAIDLAPLENEYAYDLVPSGEGIDLLFNPGVRQKLKKWQRDYFDPRLPDYIREKVRDNLEKAFSSLIYKGQGPKEKLTPGIKREIDAHYLRVRVKVENIFRNHKEWVQRKNAVLGAFGGTGEKIYNNYVVKTTRDVVNGYFAIRHHLSPRTVDEYLREEREPFTQMEDDSAVGVIIDGQGKGKTVTVEREDGSFKIIK